MTHMLSWFAAIFILLASTGALINRDWRVQLGALAAQYLAAFWLINQHLPFAMGAAKLVTGWMVVAALGMTRLSLATHVDEKDESFGTRGRSFPIVLAGVVALVTAGATPRIEAIIPGLGLQVIAGSLLLMGMGLIHLGLTSNVFHVLLGLLTMLTGFEIIYAAVESSILVAGLLALTNLGLALVGSYLLIADYSSKPIFEEQQ